MTDETKTGVVPPIYPDAYTIPVQILEQWYEIPLSDKIAAPLTRQDIDHLLIGLLRMVDAQGKLDKAVTDWSNGRIDDANAAIFESRRLNLDAQNHIRQLATALMAAAIRERTNAK